MFIYRHWITWASGQRQQTSKSVLKVRHKSQVRNWNVCSTRPRFLQLWSDLICARQILEGFQCVEFKSKPPASTHPALPRKPDPACVLNIQPPCSEVILRRVGAERINVHQLALGERVFPLLLLPECHRDLEITTENQLVCVMWRGRPGSRRWSRGAGCSSADCPRQRSEELPHRWGFAALSVVRHVSHQGSQPLY